MAHQIIRTEQAPAPVGPYSQAVAATGRMLFLSGQVALDPETGNIVGAGDVVQQTERVLANLTAVLQAAGATLQHVVKTTVFLTDMNDFAAVNAIYAQHFGEETAPARSCVQVSRLPKDVRVEIECIAVLPTA